MQSHRTSLNNSQTKVEVSLLQASTLLKYFSIFADVAGQEARTEFLHNYNATVSPPIAKRHVQYTLLIRPFYSSCVKRLGSSSTSLSTRTRTGSKLRLSAGMYSTVTLLSHTILIYGSHRSAAYSFMLDAFKISSSGASAAKVTGVDFLLPSDNNSWCSSRETWRPPYEAPLSLMSMVTALNTSQNLSDALSNFALATLAADLLNKVCSFRAICSSNAEFPEAQRGLQALADVFEANSKFCDSWDAEDPLSHCAVSFLSSARYHLHVDKPLEFIASALQAPASLNDQHRVKGVCDTPISYEEQRALQVAADLWRKDCLVGLRYISSLGPYKFSPLSTAAMLERGMPVIQSAVPNTVLANLIR